MQRSQLLLISVLLSSTISAQGIDPRGIYFNRFTGGFAGTEWFQVTPVTGSSTSFNIRDIYGGGFLGTINSSGTIIIPGASPNGSFSDPDNFVIFPFGGQFTFTSNRAPTTDTSFPLQLFSPRVANPLLNGQWFNTLRFINPETGQVTGSGTENITITTNGNTVRITDPGGLFFQGVFEDGLQAGFRVVNNPSFGTTTGQYATFLGSSTNFGRDLLGEMNMLDINNFRASFLTQTRVPLGSQTQMLIEFTAVRLNPFAQGDANGDGAVDSADQAIVDSLQGTTFADNNYDLAADLNADGSIDGTDLAFFTGTFTDLGNQLVGSSAPTLSGSGSLAATQPFTMTVANSPLSTTGVLILGFTAINVPFAGGVFVPDPTIAVPFPTPALATDVFAITSSIGAGSLPAMTDIFVQSWFVDAGGPAGLSASNGLRMTTP